MTTLQASRNFGFDTDMDMEMIEHSKKRDSESPAMSLTGGQNGQIPKSPEIEEPELSNQISAAYEVPQFPIEQIEKKLLLQRHLTAK
ncbi:hypothetical protein PVAND_013431 [Polypedilum vanderplanki]|uniref:Uncharacterized protein n=1 Tax=Polypedilum vanderplanki TaxID=319348 RepID=A0A9J6CQG3_POLVA|nr:hypothetical protein PVAND_013431 [Polypedilum vanderplanki]